jgi:hypothetical protein
MEVRVIGEGTHVFEALALSLKAQFGVDETGESLQRLFAGSLRDNLEKDSQYFRHYHQPLFDGHVGLLQDYFARAGLPHCKLENADKYNPSWLFALQLFAPQPVHMLVYNTFNMSMFLAVFDAAMMPMDRRYIYDYGDIVTLRHSTTDVLWLLHMNGQFFALENTERPRGDDVDVYTEVQELFELEKKQVLSELTMENLALTGHLHPTEFLNHAIAYLTIDINGVASVVPYRASIGLAVGLESFPIVEVDIDSILLVGTNIDLIFTHFHAAGTPSTMVGNKSNTPIQEGGE